jgi:hypothetical protein
VLERECKAKGREPDRERKARDKKVGIGNCKCKQQLAMNSMRKEALRESRGDTWDAAP